MSEEKPNFKEMTDEEVIALIKNGDLYAQDYIIEKYKTMVKSKARTYFLIGADREDIIQEGMIGLYKAIRDFDESKNVSFRHFADLCINRQILTAIKMATRQKHIPLNSYVSLNRPVFEDDIQQSYIDIIKEMDSYNPETMIIGQEEKNIMESRIAKSLSKFENKVLFFYLQGKSYQEIGEILGKPEKSIDNALQRVKHKIEKLK